MRPRSDNMVMLLVLLAFVGIVVWLLRRTEIAEEPKYSQLTTYSPKPDGALALYDLCEASGLKPKRFADTEYHYPKDGCVVILDASGFGSVLGGIDAKAVRLWLERGGRMVLCAEPDSDFGLTSSLFKELQADEPTPVVLKEVSQPKCEATADGNGTKGKLTPYGRFDSNGDVYKLPNPRFALFTGVDRIEHARIATPTMIEAVQLLGSDAPVLWYRKVGKGELYWLTRPEMASNGWISRKDNHRLLLNVIEAAARGRTVYFDEHIHGFARETPNLLAIMFHTRGGQLLLALCALSLLLFAGAAVRPAKYTSDNVPERRIGVEMVLAQADLYERAGARHVIADSQIDSLRRAYMERRHLASPPSEQQLLDWIEQSWRGDAKRSGVLREYLRSRLLPRSQHALLELARACDEAKSMLT